ncbi:hypothetical protein HOK51_03410 [Candidatus Woesearchaeota archaeon]|jgi:hypothetical protein|nr:hypothetical protein [Candidatus Woesearchaeota archaeon]MBT6518868.1 hypothetical protein [Candidatus Woesearchaeota archaeon]MBT7368007.1 hypothetical protein [Candidatus Woesearchaeota archaeon]
MKKNFVLENIEIENHSLAIIVLAIIMVLAALASSYFFELINFAISIMSSLLGVFLTILFVNYLTTREAITFKERYLKKLKPTFNRNFFSLFIDISKFVKFKNRKSYFEEKSFEVESDRRFFDLLLNKFDDLAMDNRTMRKAFDNYEDYEFIFRTYKDRLVCFTQINSTFLPPNFVLHMSRMVERLDSLILQIKIKDKQLVFKNIKAILNHLNIIDKDHFQII